MESETARIETARKVLRSIVRIDRQRCDGCGVCAARCPEGAVHMVDGRAELVAEELCDGIGLCASVCPNRAIRMENRQAVPFDPEGSASRRLAPGIGPEAEFRRRLQICCRASNCGRLCPRLVKQPGKAGVWCVDIQTGGKTELYRVLADPAFKCPEERF